MGTAYTAVTVSGYNSSPPSDNAADQTSSNKVQWQKHLDKIGAPLKTAIEAIDAQLTTKGWIAQFVEATPITAYSSASTALPLDDTIPQNTEGTQIITASITPKSTSNRLVIEAEIAMAGDAADRVLIAALFQDSTANALAVATQTDPASGTLMNVTLRHEMAAGTTSATTFKIRAGTTTGTYYFNGNASARLFGGILACRMRITEIAA